MYEYRDPYIIDFTNVKYYLQVRRNHPLRTGYRLPHTPSVGRIF